MTKSNRQYIYNSVGEKTQTNHTDYDFFFSDDIEHWMVGYHLRWNRKNKKK